MKNFSSLSYLFSGFKYISNSKWTWRYILSAFVIDVIVFIALIISFILSLDWITISLSNTFNFPLGGLFEILFKVIFFLIGIVILSRLFISLSNIINSPIYGKMTEEFLERHNVNNVIELSFLQEVSYSIKFEIKKLLLLIGFLILMTFINFIPLIGQVLFLLISGIQIIIFAGLDFFDPYLTRKSYTLSEKIKYILKKPSKHYPFLLISGFLTSIPLVNIFLLPVFIVSGLLIVSDNYD